MYNIVYYIYYYYTIYINSIIYYTILYRYCGVDDGGFKQPPQPKSGYWPLGLGEAAQLLHIEQSMVKG